MKIFGIDVSKWQGNFNFAKAKDEGVEFVILRGAYSTGKDTKFEQYYSACKALNIPVGVYHYSMAKTVTEARTEANFLINNVLKGKQFEYPIYMDVEDKVQLALGKDLLTEIVIAFCDTLEKAGYYAGIYSTAYVLKTYTHETKLNRFDKWIAQWAKDCTYKGSYGMWQFGGETNLIRTNMVAGVKCDQDYCYKDYPTIIKKNKLNGYKEVKSVEVLAQEVLDGKWGAGRERKNRLTSAGYSYTDVQNKVNEMLKPKTYTVKSGDTITSIAKANNTTVDKLVADNNLIKSGMVLKL